jgi:predicted metal-dependent phosphoesterase TrpH
MKFDMHVHTWSSDGTATVRELAGQAKKIGLAGFAITDHNTIKAHEKIRRIKDLIIIPGEEINSEKGHVLAYMINERVPPHLSVEETIDKIHEQGGIAVAAHPFDIGLGVRDFHKHKFDAVEIHNGLAHHKMIKVKKIVGYAKKMKVPVIGGSDSHIKETLGNCYTKSPEVNSAEQLIKNVLKNKTTAHRKLISIEEFVKQNIKRETECFKFTKDRSITSRIIAHTLVINKPFIFVKKLNQIALPIINTIDYLSLRKY